MDSANAKIVDNESIFIPESYFKSKSCIMFFFDVFKVWLYHTYDLVIENFFATKTSLYIKILYPNENVYSEIVLYVVLVEIFRGNFPVSFYISLDSSNA